MAKLIPFGGHLGIFCGKSSLLSWLETGTAERVSNMENEDADGPKGLKGSRIRSDVNTEVPSLLCPVTTKRGLERVMLFGVDLSDNCMGIGYTAYDYVVADMPLADEYRRNGRLTEMFERWF